MAAPQAPQSHPVKLRAEAYAALEHLVAQVARSGWAAIGRHIAASETPERVTKEAVTAYALLQLKAKAKTRSKR